MEPALQLLRNSRHLRSIQIQVFEISAQKPSCIPFFLIHIQNNGPHSGPYKICDHLTDLRPCGLSIRPDSRLSQHSVNGSQCLADARVDHRVGIIVQAGFVAVDDDQLAARLLGHQR